MVRNVSSSSSSSTTSSAMEGGHQYSIEAVVDEEADDEDEVFVTTAVSPSGGGNGPYPSYSMGPMECILVFLLFLLWCYAVRRFYVVWSNVLNFSATESLAHGIGWDAFFQWAIEHFRSIRNTRLSSSILGGSRNGEGEGGEGGDGGEGERDQEEGQELRESNQIVIKSNVSTPPPPPPDAVPTGTDERRLSSSSSSSPSPSAVVVITNYESGGKMTSDV